MDNRKCVQFGCGGNRLEGWTNHDSEVDIAKPLPYPDNSVDFILIEHCLEHVTSHEALSFLRESYRILSKGGAIRICVPMLDNIFDPEHASDLITGHGHKMVYSFESLAGMLFAAGFGRKNIVETPWQACDGHWRVIGKDKDAVETLRVEATK